MKVEKLPLLTENQSIALINKCLCGNTEWQSYAKTKKYNSRTGKSQAHSSSAKPVFSRANKFEYFKVKSQSKSKKKQIISVQGIKYNSRPSLQPHSQGNKIRRDKYCLGNFHGDMKNFKFTCQCEICRIITADMSNSNYLDNSEDLVQSQNSRMYCSEKKSKKSLRKNGNAFLRRYCQGRRERPKDLSFGGIYYDEVNDKFQTTYNIHPSDVSYEKDNDDFSINLGSEIMSAHYSDKKAKKKEEIPDPTNPEVIQQMKRNHSIEKYNSNGKRWTKVLTTSPKKLEKPSIQKVKSFKNKNDISSESYANKDKLTKNPKIKQRPNTNRMDSLKDLENSKVKPKIKTKKR